MGTRGPAPKRSSERRRRNRDSRPDKVRADGVVGVPPADEGWHPIARDWYEALKESGQSQFFEPSDWQAARYVAEVMTRNLSAGRFSAQLFVGVWSAMTELLTTEASRRRVRVEIERETGESRQPAGVTALDEYRRSLGA